MLIPLLHVTSKLMTPIKASCTSSRKRGVHGPWPSKTKSWSRYIIIIKLCGFHDMQTSFFACHPTLVTIISKKLSINLAWPYFGMVGVFYLPLAILLWSPCSSCTCLRIQLHGGGIHRWSWLRAWIDTQCIVEVTTDLIVTWIGGTSCTMCCCRRGIAAWGIGSAQCDLIGEREEEEKSLQMKRHPVLKCF